MNKATFLLVILALGLAASTAVVEDNNAADELVREIQKQENEVREEQQNHRTLWESQQVDCTNEIGFRHQEVTDAKVALAASQIALGNCENALSAAEADKAKAEGHIVSINKTLENLRVQRETEHARYVRVVEEELTPAIDAVEGVYPILAEFSESNQNGSFLQLTNHLNKSFIHIMKAQKSISFGTALVQILAAQEVGISQDTIDTLYSLFDKLLDDLKEERAQEEDNEKASVAAYETAVQEFNNIIATLETTIANLEVYIVDLNTCIQTEEAVSASAEAKESRNSTALEHAVEMCAAFQTEYDNSTSARNEELALLAKLKAFVREQEDIFGNYGNDGVNAFEEYQKSFAQSKASVRSNFLQLTLKNYNANPKVASVPSKCESCRKSFLQKKLGF